MSALACCTVLEAALDELAARGLESDDRPRLLLAALRGATVGTHAPADVAAAWGELYGREDAPTGALGQLAYAAQLSASLLTCDSTGWVGRVGATVRVAAREALAVTGRTGAEVSEMVTNTWEQALGARAA